MSSHLKCIICEGKEDFSLHAGSKAPTDVLSFLQEQDFSLIHIGYIHRARWYRPILIPFYAILLAYYLRHYEVVLFQHPYDTFHNALMRINSLAFTIAGKSYARKIVLIHDIETIRFHKGSTAQEMDVLKNYDGIIVHSPQMKMLLKNCGCVAPISVLGLFDYKVSAHYTGHRLYSTNVVFAGNLSKSTFLYQELELSGVQLYLYGSKPETDFYGPLVYKGRFLPDDLSGIDGSWGLVWDGNSVNQCDGELGEYLKYNSPHKASLYVCAHLPLIVPADSAVARIVSENNIGITISSLLELGEAIASVSNNQYEEMQNNIKKFAERLTSGGNLKEAISGLE